MKDWTPGTSCSELEKIWAFGVTLEGKRYCPGEQDDQNSICGKEQRGSTRSERAKRTPVAGGCSEVGGSRLKINRWSRPLKGLMCPEAHDGKKGACRGNPRRRSERQSEHLGLGGSLPWGATGGERENLALNRTTIVWESGDSKRVKKVGNSTRLPACR